MGSHLKTFEYSAHSFEQILIKMRSYIEYESKKVVLLSLLNKLAIHSYAFLCFGACNLFFVIYFYHFGEKRIETEVAKGHLFLGLIVVIPIIGAIILINILRKWIKDDLPDGSKLIKRLMKLAKILMKLFAGGALLFLVISIADE